MGASIRFWSEAPTEEGELKSHMPSDVWKNIFAVLVVRVKGRVKVTRSLRLLRVTDDGFSFI